MEPPDDHKSLDPAKLPPKRANGEDLIFAAARIVARAMALRSGSMPGREWTFGLSSAEFGRVAGAIDGLDKLLRWGFDADIQLLDLPSKCGLKALLVSNQPRSKPLTLLCRLDGRTLWVATGCHSRADRVNKPCLASGDNIAAEWLSTRR